MTCMSGGKTVIATSISVRIRDCIGFAFLNCFIGLENSRHPLSKLDAKLKPIATWSLELNLIKKKIKNNGSPSLPHIFSPYSRSVTTRDSAYSIYLP